MILHVRDFSCCIAHALCCAAAAYDTAAHSQAEKTFNPFLRCDEPALQAFAGSKDPVDVLAAVRRAKDNF